MDLIVLEVLVIRDLSRINRGEIKFRRFPLTLGACLCISMLL